MSSPVSSADAGAFVDGTVFQVNAETSFEVGTFVDEQKCGHCGATCRVGGVAVSPSEKVWYCQECIIAQRPRERFPARMGEPKRAEGACSGCGERKAVAMLIQGGAAGTLRRCDACAQKNVNCDDLGPVTCVVCGVQASLQHTFTIKINSGMTLAKTTCSTRCYAALHAETAKHIPLSASCAAAGCGKDKAGKRCARCKSSYYCDAGCQKRDWPSHRVRCQRVRSIPAIDPVHGLRAMPPPSETDEKKVDATFLDQMKNISV